MLLDHARCMLSHTSKVSTAMQLFLLVSLLKKFVTYESFKDYCIGLPGAVIETKEKLQEMVKQLNLYLLTCRI